jgi:membrane fusion protein (multidrug efflux system)
MSYQPPPEAVTTVVAEPSDWQGTLEAVGSVAPVQGVTVAADLPGVVEKIHFASGARVAGGQVLVSLDTKLERAQLESARAQLDLAKIQLDRSKKLIDQQAIPQAEYDLAVATSRQAEAAVATIEATIDRKTIRAPFDGTTGIRQVNVGQYLNSGDPVVPVQATHTVYVDFSVPQQQVVSLKAGDPVTVAPDSGRGTALHGRVTTVNPVIDNATRNAQVQATFQNPKGALRPGMYVNVEVELPQSSRVIALPASAINYAPYGNSVFIVDDMKSPDGKKTYRGVRQQFVTLGQGRGDQIAVLTGVEPGQEVVTSGVFKLRTGAAITVNNQVQPGNNPAPKPTDS